MVKIAIIDYGSGNLRSVFNAFEKIKSDFSDDFEFKITKEKDDLKNATHLFLQGVGAYKDCVEGLKKNDLFFEIKEQVLKNNKKFMGICVGMQVLSEFGLEDEKCQGFEFFEGFVDKIENINKNPDFKLPQMGWNELKINENHKILNDLDVKNEVNFYFANSFYFKAKNQQDILAYVDYCGVKIPAIIVKNNIYGIQFHPEKSAADGLKILRNFTKL